MPIPSSNVETVRAMLLGFEKDYATQAELDEFLTLFAEDVHWYDHAFRVYRIGRPAIAGLRTSFLHCNQPFHTVIKSIDESTTGVTAEMVWEGRTTNDIVRPDGQVAVKATGKDFKCHVCILFKFDPKTGAIARIDEYYNKQWDDGIHEDQYIAMRGASLKQT